MAINPIPESYPRVVPYLIVQGVIGLIDFLVQVFEAEETERMVKPDGSIFHAEVKIGDSIIMLGEAPADFQVMPGSLYVYVTDTDAAYDRALQAGATSTMEPADQYYGDRNASVKDPFGNTWWIATHVEDVSPEELKRRAKTEMQKPS